MAGTVPPPDPHSLLPPLLACLPTAFASSRPPPALIPLLSPILRQRLHFGSYSGSDSSSSDGWLSLLCWNREQAEQLKVQIESVDFEPHPVSGEIEVGEVSSIQYKWADKETLRARIILADWPLLPIYIWCTGSEEGDSWKLAELLPSTEAAQEVNIWFLSVSEADANAMTTQRRTPLLAEGQPRPKSLPRADDDDYWAQYDSSPSRTPARMDSAVPQHAQTSETDYYAQYGDVQPALDNHDPDEASAEVGDTSLNGNALQQLLSGQISSQSEHQSVMFPGPIDTYAEPERKLSQPMPSTPSSRTGSDTVEKMEERAQKVSQSDIAVRQHISTTIKSMFRLAKSSGMDREEFEDLVQRELETLSILDNVL